MKKCGKSKKTGMISAEPTSIFETVGKVDIVARDIDDDFIKSRIFTVRGVQVMFDSDLAVFYGVPTKRLNEQVKRNVERFPDDFMFQPTAEELGGLRSQFATSNRGRGGARYTPYAFTEHGIIMLASVLKSGTAVEASIRITHAFVAMRRALSSIAPLLSRIDTMERRQITDQQRNEERFDTIFKAMDGGEFPHQGEELMGAAKMCELGNSSGSSLGFGALSQSTHSGDDRKAG